MSIRFERRPAREGDREFARAAHHAACRDFVERQFGSWDEAMQDDFFAAQWDPDAQEIIVVDGERCGYCAVEYRADDIHLRELVVHPEYQGRGVGTELLRRLQIEARPRPFPFSSECSMRIKR